MASLVPVMVRTFGRTGSTLLMQVLGTNKRVVFERNYPFEHRYLTYVYQMSRVAGLPPAVSDDWNNDVMFRGTAPFVGGLPYGGVSLLDRETLSTQTFVSLWQTFSAQMREASGLTADQSCFYAEKVPHKVAEAANEHLNGRNIFLLRDPRDEMVSIKSFNAKRGFSSFGWLDSDTDESYAKKMCANRRQFMQNMIEIPTDHKRINVRYEDLIREGESEAARLSDWLGATLNYREATNNKAIKKRHMTSRNAAASVERWRRELSGDVLNIFHRELGDELNGLGYPV